MVIGPEFNVSLRFLDERRNTHLMSFANEIQVISKFKGLILRGRPVVNSTVVNWKVCSLYVVMKDDGLIVYCTALI